MSETLREAQEFIDRNWRTDVDPDEWREKVIDAGWAALRWPRKWHGRELSEDDATEVEELFASRGVPGPEIGRAHV